VSASPFPAQEIKSSAWARYYARHSTFAATAAPRIRELYEATYGTAAERNILDLCCGVGTLAQSSEALSSCFACVRRALAPGGMFVFDLMTRNGFWLDYNYLGVRDTEDELYILKSVYDGAEKAAVRLTGFMRDGDHWERFDEFRTPTLFPAPAVITALHEAGWTQVQMTSAGDLRTPITDPEQFDRIFFLATGA
jgi:hypothetical protein